MRLILSALIAALPIVSYAADPIEQFPASGSARASAGSSQQAEILTGRASVIDGRTLWFPQYVKKVRLLDIDACDLRQWALNPIWNNRKIIKAPPPVPCGAFAKAWLKRSIANQPVQCIITGADLDQVAIGKCTIAQKDLGLEMIRVGWARITSPYPSNQQYALYQRAAIAARYGMWATYVLDMDEWRRKAIDQSASRQPIADANLLIERESEISPPFQDARRKPVRTDR